MSDPSDLPIDIEGAAIDSGILFTQAMRQTRMAVCLTDPHREDNPIVFVNRAFTELTGYAEGELLGRNCRLLQGPDTDRKTLDVLRKAIEEEEVVVVELRNYRKDGTSFWNALHLGPIYDRDGTLQFFFGSQWDATALRVAKAEEHLAQMFTRELAHRMKNMFAVVAGIVSISARHAGVPRVALEINERIAAMGRAHQDAFASELNAHVELGRVARLTLDPYIATAGSRISIRGEHVMLESATVSLVGLALHELAANALKHGALADEQGEIELDWAIDRRRALVLQWRERLSSPRAADDGTDERAGPGTSDGMGRPGGSGGSGGSGAGIVEDLVNAAGGRLERRWHEDGLRVRFELPLDGVLAGADLSGTSS